MARAVDIPVRFSVDDASVNRAKQSIDDIERRVEQLDDAVTNLNQLEGAIDDIFTRVGAGALAVFAPSILAANNYVNSVEEVTDATRRWSETQERLQQQQMQFGRTATEAILPFYELLADIVEELNSIDPSILRGGIQAAGLIAGFSTIMLLGAQVTRMVSAVYDLTSAIIKLQAVGGLQGAAATGLVRGAVGVGAIGVGTVAGIGAVRGIGQATGDERLQEYGFDDLFETLKQILFIVGAGFIEFSESIAEGIVNLRSVVQVAGLLLEKTFADVKDKLSDKFQDIIDALEAALIGLQKFVLDIPGVGDLLGALGLDEDDVRRRERALASRQGDGNAFNRFRDIGQRDQPDEFERRAAELVREREESLSQIERNSDKLKRDFLDILGYGEDTEEAMEGAKEAAEGLAALSEEQLRQVLDDFEALQEELADAERDFLERRKQQIEDFNAQQLEAERAFYAAQEQAAEDFRRSQSQAASDFYSQQKAARAGFEADTITASRDFFNNQQKARADFEASQRQQIGQFQREQLRAERDFRREQQRAQEDYERSILESAAAFDFASIAKQRADFRIQQQRETEDFRTQQQDRREQLDERLRQEREEFEALQAEREEHFRTQQQQQAANFEAQEQEAREHFRTQQQQQAVNFERQQQQADDAFRDQQQQQRAEFNERLADEQVAFNERQAERKRQFEAELEALIEHNTRTEEEMQRHYDQLRQELDAFTGAATNTDQGRDAPQRREMTEFADGDMVNGAMARGLNAPLTNSNASVTNTRTTTANSQPTIVLNGGQVNENAVRRIFRQEFQGMLQELAST